MSGLFKCNLDTMRSNYGHQVLVRDERPCYGSQNIEDLQQRFLLV
jgi:hypothetical protein